MHLRKLGAVVANSLREVALKRSSASLRFDVTTPGQHAPQHRHLHQIFAAIPWLDSAGAVVDGCHSFVELFWYTSETSRRYWDVMQIALLGKKFQIWINWNRRENANVRNCTKKLDLRQESRRILQCPSHQYSIEWETTESDFRYVCQTRRKENQLLPILSWAAAWRAIRRCWLMRDIRNSAGRQVSLNHGKRHRPNVSSWSGTTDLSQGLWNQCWKSVCHSSGLCISQTQQLVGKVKILRPWLTPTGQFWLHRCVTARLELVIDGSLSRRSVTLLFSNCCWWNKSSWMSKKPCQM